MVGKLQAEWQGQGLAPGVDVMVGTTIVAHSMRVANVDEDFGGGGSADAGLAGAIAASSGTPGPGPPPPG